MLATLLLMVLGCGPKQGSTHSGSMSQAPSANVYLRNSLDADPSAYIGRFVVDGASDLDESSSMTLACSQHISYRFVEGGGVKYNELLQVSTEASARLGIPVVASGSGSGSSSRVVRVSYELTGKMIATIADPAAFASCCKDAPDQCSGRYIGEFIQGRGAIFHQADASVQVDASGLHPTSGTNGDIEFSHGTSWQRGVEFPNPVYFAFKISQTPYQQQAVTACSRWMQPLPPAPEGGRWVTGTSEPSKSEQNARNAALRNAMTQAAYSSGSAGDPSSMPAVRPEDWCIEATQTSDGTRYVARVLAFVSSDAAPPPGLVTTPAPVPAPVTTPAPVEEPSVVVPPGAPGTLGPRGPRPGGPRPGAPVRGPGQVAPEDPGTIGVPAPVPVPVPVPVPMPGAVGAPMSAADIEQLRSAIEDAPFSADKLAVLMAASPGRTLTCGQVALLLPAFPFSADQLAAVQILLPSISDPQNGYQLATVFTFSSDKDAVLQLFR